MDETHAADVQKYDPRIGLKKILDFHSFLNMVIVLYTITRQ